MKERYGNVVGGKEDFEGEESALRSPADGSLITAVVHADRGKTKEAIDAAEDAFRKWSKTSLKERQGLLLKLAERIQSRADEYSLLETLNTGKTIRQSTMMDLPLGIEHIRYFGTTKDVPAVREIEHPEFPGTTGIVQYAPIGVVGAIAPWNLPFPHGRVEGGTGAAHREHCCAEAVPLHAPDGPGAGKGLRRSRLPARRPERSDRRR